MENHGHNADIHTEHCACGCKAEESDRFETHKKQELLKIITACIFFAAGYILDEFLKLPEYISALFFAVSYAIAGFEVIKEALENILRKNIFSEYFLMSAASLGAFAIKEYSEGCAVMLLYIIGEYIQDSSLAKSRKEIRRLEGEHGFEHSHLNSGTERFISRFARVYTPVVCLAAVLVIVINPLFFNGLWHEWIYRGLSVLVIGCPCAIVISVPLSFSCAMGACTKKGIFVHCSDALEKLNKAESSDEIVIKGNDKEQKLNFAKKAAKKAVIVSRENIAFALAVKLVVFVLAVFLEKEVPLWLAEFSDVGVAILAIINSLRCMRVK